MTVVATHIAMSDLTETAWRGSAARLAAWTMRYMVNRVDVWGQYLPIERRSPSYTALTAPPKADRGLRMLNLDILQQHFEADDPGHIIGLHTTSPSNTSKFIAIDADNHERDPAKAESNFIAMEILYHALIAMGFSPLLFDSDGQGGFHLVIILAEPIPTATAYRFVRHLLEKHADIGLPADAETFPKQESIKGDEFGNWLRIPGRHHTCDHWTRVYDSAGDWYSGQQAVDAILTHTGVTSRWSSLPALGRQNASPTWRTCRAAVSSMSIIA